MKTKFIFISFVLIAALLAGCGDLVIGGKKVRTIQASDTFASEKRDVTGFHAVDISTVGNVLLSQGAEESVTVQGSDNIVPLIKTTVENGVLVIKTDEPLNIVGMKGKNILTFVIQVKELDGVTVSGVAEVNMDQLSAPSLELNMSGAGKVNMQMISGMSLKVTVSGVGDVKLSGIYKTANIVISGAGPIDAADLRLQTADVNISGIGGATLWVTDRLTGTVSGAGSVSYYGNPQTSTKATGVGVFKSLGNK
jgi:hypothetical protein